MKLGVGGKEKDPKEKNLGAKPHVNLSPNINTKCPQILTYLDIEILKSNWISP